MALNTSGLEEDLEELFSNPASGFAGVADQWGNVLSDYVQAIVPASTTVTAAVSTLKTSLATAFEAGQIDGTGATTAASLELAFAAFAATIGSGMAPTFVATPPTLPVGWASALASTPPSTHAEAADRYSNLIDVWMRTGTAVPSIGGSSINWS